MNKWKETAVMNYYNRESDGRVLGSVWHNAFSKVCYQAKIFTEEFPYTDQCEKHLGTYIDDGFARAAVEKYWVDKGNLLEMK